MVVSLLTNVLVGGMFLFVLSAAILYLKSFFALDKERLQTLGFYSLILGSICYLLFGVILIADDVSSSLLVQLVYTVFFVSLALMMLNVLFFKKVTKPFFIILVCVLFVSLVGIVFTEDYDKAILGAKFGIATGVLTGIFSIIYDQIWLRVKERGSTHTQTPQEKNVEMELYQKSKRAKHLLQEAPPYLTLMFDSLFKRIFGLFMAGVNFYFGAGAFLFWAVSVALFFWFIPTILNAQAKTRKQPTKDAF